MLVYGSSLLFTLDAVVENHKEIILLNLQKFLLSKKSVHTLYGYRLSWLVMSQLYYEWGKSSIGRKYCVRTYRYKRLI